MQRETAEAGKQRWSETWAAASLCHLLSKASMENSPQTKSPWGIQRIKLGGSKRAFLPLQNLLLKLLGLPDYLRLFPQMHFIIPTDSRLSSPSWFYHPHGLPFVIHILRIWTSPALLWLEICLQTGCLHTCSRYHFFCDDGCCIDITLACDGVQQCPDGSDEDFCQNRELAVSHCQAVAGRDGVGRSVFWE